MAGRDGFYVFADEVAVCGDCGALLYKALTEIHQMWHQSLTSRSEQPDG